MTAKADNVGFLATESGVKQFQPCLGGSFVLKGAPHNTGESLPYGMKRGDGGNVRRTRGLFPTMLERADTKEAIGPNRPRLRSTTYHYQHPASLSELRPTKDTMKPTFHPQFSILAGILGAFAQLSTFNAQPASAQSPVPDSFNPMARQSLHDRAFHATAEPLRRFSPYAAN